MSLRVAVLTLTMVTWSSTLSCGSDIGQSEAGRTLQESIDRLIAAGAPNYTAHASPLSADTEFVRRVYLDLTGRIPSSRQAREFLSSTASDKRKDLIDRLLESPEHVRHMQYVFDAMLMERRPANHVKLGEWREYLYESFRQNKSWIELTGELLAADGASAQHRAAARFLLDRELNTEEVAVPIGRLFLGRDLECAECHDHPEVGEYLQRHVFGIWAFLNRTYLFENPGSALTSLGETATGDAEFTSALTHVKSTTSPRILDLPEIKDPPLEENPYHAQPGADARGVPKYSRRLQLASALVSPENEAYRLNIANRLWAMLLGRGLVDPVEMFHAANPPSHPELLELLANDLLEHGYDMRRTIRAIVLSDTYQRSAMRRTDTDVPQQGYYAALPKPMSPEQLAWSMMQATGVIENTRLAVAERLDQRSLRPRVRKRKDGFQLEKAICEELQEYVDAFVDAFTPGDEFSLLDDAERQDTFLETSPLLTEWLQPAGENLINRLLKLEAASAIADELYLAVFTRPATESEIDTVSGFLEGSSKDLSGGLQKLVRQMLCSPEFRLNQ